MELTNKTLAMFLVAAIVVSLAGTIISLNKLGTLTTTGYATDADTGTAQVQVNSTTSIIFKNNAVNFASGSVNSSGTQQNCTLITGVTKSTDCIGFIAVNNGLELENNGNTNVSVVIKSNTTALQMFGGTAVSGSPQFKYNASNNETSSCNSFGTAVNWTNFTTGDVQICDVLDFVDGSDSLNISIWLNIPYTSPAGVKAATVTATATSI